MIYFDAAATRAVLPEVMETCKPYFKDSYGNPSALYDMGLDARRAVEQSRRTIANILNCSPSEIFFTSGGTESDNWALNGRGVYCSSIEHHAVLNHINNGIIPCNSQGIVSLNYLKSCLSFATKETKYKPIVSIMYANNEIGVIEPIEDAAEIAHHFGCKFHTDAVQYFGHGKIDLSYIDYMSVSGHKIGAMKGIGFLYAKDGLIASMLKGGEQERGHRAGTENVPAIVSLAVASDVMYKNLESNNMKLRNLQSYLYTNISKNFPMAHLNGTDNWDERLPNILSFRFDGYQGEVLQSFLNDFGIAVGTGSACNSGNGKPSHVLKSIGLSDEESNSTIRFSYTENNTLDDIDTLINVLKQAITILR